jgi:hypothetical protein
MIFLYILAVIVAAFFFTALLVKKDFSLEKDIVINKTQKEVFDYLKLIRNQEKYSVWVMRDPKVNIIYTGTDGTVGFKSAWTSNDKNVGIGEQEIIKMTEGVSTEVEIRFKKPFEAINWAKTTVSAVNEQETRVQQLFYGRSKFPMNIMNLFMDKLLGKDMLQNLMNMKKNLEEN